MILVNGIIMYLATVGIMLLILKKISVVMLKVQNKLKEFLNRKQLNYLNNRQLKNLIRTIKIELFLLNILNKFIQGFPSKEVKNYTNEETTYFINGNVEYYKFYLIKFLPINIFNVLIVLCILQLFYEIPIVSYIFNINLPTFKELKTWISLASPLIVILIIVLAFYFLSPSGLIRTTKKAVHKDNLKTQIEFHFKHKGLFYRALRTANQNVGYIINNQKDFIENRIHKKAFYLENLLDIDEISLLAKAINNFKVENSNLELFTFGISHKVCYDLEREFSKQMDENEISEILQSIFITKESFDTFYFSKNDEFLVYKFSKCILNSIKFQIYIHKYLKIVEEKIVKKHNIFDFLSFITNKDK